MKSIILSMLAVSCAAMPQAAAPSVTPSPTLGSNNIHTLMALGYNPAQASYYASVITQPAVKSAYEALNSEGAIDKLNAATAETEYNSILMDAVASLPDDLRAPATSFFGGLEMLGASVTAAQASASSSDIAQSMSEAISSNSKTVTSTGSLLFASMPTSMSAVATGAAQGSSATPASSANSSQSRPSSSVSQAAAAPRQTNLAIGAVVAGAIGLAAAL